MEDKYYILVGESHYLIGIFINNAPESAVEIDKPTFDKANQAMGECPPDMRTEVSEDFQTYKYVPMQWTPTDQLLVELNSAHEYLNNTDWYYARKAETGEEVPAAVVEKRKTSRQFIIDHPL